MLYAVKYIDLDMLVDEDEDMDGDIPGMMGAFY